MKTSESHFGDVLTILNKILGCYGKPASSWAYFAIVAYHFCRLYSDMFSSCPALAAKW